MFCIDFICLPHILQGKNYHVRVFGTLNSLCHPVVKPRDDRECGGPAPHDDTEKKATG